jgi:hypothetical protein
MHRKSFMTRRIIAGSAVALLLVLGGAVAAMGGPVSPDRSNGGHDHTVRLDVEFSPFEYVDVGKQGPSAGDMTVFHDTLESKGRKAGDEGGACTIVDVAETLLNCVGTVRLKDGTITYQGLATPDPTKKLVVTGGTGRYTGARGEATVVEFGNGKGSLTIRLAG